MIYCIPHLLEKHDVATLLVLPKGEGREPSHLRNIMSAGTTQRSGFRLEEFYRNVYICKKKQYTDCEKLKEDLRIIEMFLCTHSDLSHCPYHSHYPLTELKNV